MDASELGRLEVAADEASASPPRSGRCRRPPRAAPPPIGPGGPRRGPRRPARRRAPSSRPGVEGVEPGPPPRTGPPARRGAARRRRRGAGRRRARARAGPRPRRASSRWAPPPGRAGATFRERRGPAFWSRERKARSIAAFADGERGVEMDEGEGVAPAQVEARGGEVGDREGRGERQRDAPRRPEGRGEVAHRVELAGSAKAFFTSGGYQGSSRRAASAGSPAQRSTQRRLGGQERHGAGRRAGPCPGAPSTRPPAPGRAAARAGSRAGSPRRGCPARAPSRAGAQVGQGGGTGRGEHGGEPARAERLPRPGRGRAPPERPLLGESGRGRHRVGRVGSGGEQRVRPDGGVAERGRPLGLAPEGHDLDAADLRGHPLGGAHAVAGQPGHRGVELGEVEHRQHQHGRPSRARDGRGRAGRVDAGLLQAPRVERVEAELGLHGRVGLGELRRPGAPGRWCGRVRPPGGQPLAGRAPAPPPGRRRERIARAAGTRACARSRWRERANRARRQGRDAWPPIITEMRRGTSRG